jgi:hypothetical protein
LYVVRVGSLGLPSHKLRDEVTFGYLVECGDHVRQRMLRHCFACQLSLQVSSLSLQVSSQVWVVVELALCGGTKIHSNMRALDTETSYFSLFLDYF